MTDTKIVELKSNVKNYLELQFRILKLELTDKLSGSGASLASIVIVSLTAFISILFLSLGLGFYLSTVLGSICYGFLAVGVMYFILALLLIMLRRKLFVDPFRDRIIREMLGNDERRSYED